MTSQTRRVWRPAARPKESAADPASSLNALRVFHTGQETLRDAGGPVTRLSFGPKSLLRPIVMATTPTGSATSRTSGRTCGTK